MAPRSDPRRTRRGRRTILGLLLSVVLLAVLWGSIAAPFRTDGDAGSGAGASAIGLRAEAARRDERARLTVTGHVPAGTGAAPFVVRVLGRTDAAAPCPIPEVRPSGVVTVPAGTTRVGWERLAGRVPGRPLNPGAAFSMTGTVALRSSGAMRLCVYLARAGSRPVVLRTVRTVVPSRAGLTPLTVVLDPAMDRVVLPALRVLAILLVIAGAAAGVALVVIRIHLVRRVVEPSPLAGWTAAAWDLPPLPDDVHVPDVVPWLAGGLSAGPGRGDPRDDVPDPRGASDPRDDVPDPRGSSDPRDDAPDSRGASDPRDDAPTPADDRPALASSDPRDDVLAPADLHDASGGSSEPSHGPALVPTGDVALAPVVQREVRAPVAAPAARASRRGRARADRASAEVLAAERFAALAGGYPGVHLLADRLEPFRSRSRIDHVLVGPAGVTVVATKHWAGTVKVVEDRLFVRGLERTKAVDGLAGQVSSVRALLAGSGLGAVPVTGVLHWSRPEGTTLDGSVVLRGVPLLDASGTMLRAVDGGVLGRDGVRRVLTVLERGLPPAR